VPRLTVTDTIPLDPGETGGGIIVLSVAELLADTIRNVFEDSSVSALFGGANEIF
jgi:phosphoribosylpyrophosphate synthetase